MKLTMKREIRIGDDRRLDIIVDGINQGKILTEEKKFDIEPGNHEIFVKSQLWKSPIYKFEATDQDIVLVCGLAKINKGIKSSVFDSIFKPGNTYTIMDYLEYEKQ